MSIVLRAVVVVWVVLGWAQARADAVIAEPTTAIKPVLGDGWSTEREALVGRCIEPKASAIQWVGSTVSSIEFTQSMAEKAVSNELGFEANTRARYGVVEAKAEARFARSSERTSTSLVSTYKANYSFKSRRAVGWSFSEVGTSANTQDQLGTNQWKAVCGHEAVTQIDYGASLYFNIRLDFSSKTARDSFAAKFKISGPSAEASAQLSKASRQFSKHVRVEISVLQIGGNTARVAQIFGMDGAQDDRLAFVECTLGTFEKCSIVLANALAYAASTGEGSFTGQLIQAVSQAQPDRMPVGMAELRYHTKPYSELVVRPGVPREIGAGWAAQRQRLQVEFERQLGVQLAAERLLGGRNVLSQRQTDALQALRKAATDNIDVLVPVSMLCYDGPADACITEAGRVLGALAPLNEAELQIKPETFAQACYLSADTLLGDAQDKRTVDAVVKLATAAGRLSSEPDQDWSFVCEATAAHVEGLSRLALVNQDLVSVRPLAFLSNLGTLNLSGNKITDPSTLATLTGLRSLDLGRNEIGQAGALKALGGLDELILVNNKPWLRCPLANAARCHMGYFNQDDIFHAKDNTHPMGIVCASNPQQQPVHVASIALHESFRPRVKLILYRLSATAQATKVAEVDVLLPSPVHIPRGTWEPYRCAVAVTPSGDVLLAGFFEVLTGTRASLHRLRAGQSRLEPIALQRAGAGYTIPDDAVDSMATLTGGTVLLFGRQPLRIDPATGQVTVLGQDGGGMPLVPRMGAQLTPLDGGDVLVTGGYAVNRPTAIVERFSTADNSFRHVSTLNIPRVLHNVVRLQDGTLLITGGLGELYSWRPLPGSEILDPKTGVSRLTKWRMAVPRAAHTAWVLPNGLAVMAGGYSTNNLDNPRPSRTMFATRNAEVFNPATQEFYLLKDTLKGNTRANHVAVPLPGGLVALIGGTHQSNEEFRFDPQRKSIDLFIPPPQSPFAAAGLP